MSPTATAPAPTTEAPATLAPAFAAVVMFLTQYAHQSASLTQEFTIKLFGGLRIEPKTSKQWKDFKLAILGQAGIPASEKTVDGWFSRAKAVYFSNVPEVRAVATEYTEGSYRTSLEAAYGLVRKAATPAKAEGEEAEKRTRNTASKAPSIAEVSAGAAQLDADSAVTAICNILARLIETDQFTKAHLARIEKMFPEFNAKGSIKHVRAA